MEQNPHHEPSENTEFIGPRLEERLSPEMMRRLVMVEALRQLNDDFLFFVPNEELTRVQTYALHPNTAEDWRGPLLHKWDRESREQVDSSGAKDAATEIGRQFISAANWLAVGDIETARDRISGALDYAGQMDLTFVPEQVNAMADAYWSDAFEDPTTPDS